MSVKTYRRGVILICAALCGALTASLNIWSIFQKPLMEAYGFSPQSVSFAYTIVIAMIGLSGPIGGWLQRKAPAHIIMTVAGIGFGLGWFLTGFASTIPVLYISFGLLVGVCDGATTLPSLSLRGGTLTSAVSPTAWLWPSWPSTRCSRLLWAT